MFWVKLHEMGVYKMLTVVDEELMGVEVREGEAVLKVEESFFKGHLTDEEGVEGLLWRASIVYFIGERAVELGLKNGLVHPEAIKRIGSIPHAQSFSLEI
ncbi:hypothetical protein EYM_05725 [Ignicoccus islandicus DSM 13165]|uniref:DUF424 family protein n=1 Tax=Ignicoccus islandicus DSM 13165 TaxID=940295 RepID=A0A0U3FPM8_9CREN|nr:DUF424 domain-containing protein [Ignicoccus islandicus]ALU11879.1 hypothetical protein EYM_05725 [Ignicoccus islandicus DSM 13165]